MIRYLIYFVIWIIGALIVALFVDSSWVQVQVNKEKEMITSTLGVSTAKHVEKGTDQLYKSLFEDTGIIEGMYHAYIPDYNDPSKNIGVVPLFFTWLRGRFDAFWWLVYQGVMRSFQISLWLPYLLPLVIASIIDGLVKRKVKKETGGYANDVRYHTAWHIILISMILPLFYMTIPVAMTPFVIPIWFVFVAATVAMFVSNAQHRI